MERVKPNHQAGFTLIEVLVCIIIIVGIITPISYSFMTSTSMQKEAQQLDRATAYAEQLLSEINQKITFDIQKHQLNQLPLPDYLMKTDTLVNLNELREESDKTLVDADLKKKYRTDEYSYEVAIWRFDAAPISDTTPELIMNSTSLKKAYKFYTHPSYQLDKASSTNKSNIDDAYLPISFKVTSMQQNQFKDIIRKQVEGMDARDIHWKHLVASYKDNDTSKEILIKDAADTRIGSTSIGKQIEVFDEGTGRIKQVGTLIDLDDSPTEEDDLGVITLDLSDVRESDYNRCIIKFINKCKYPQVIRVKLKTVDRTVPVKLPNILLEEEEGTGNALQTSIQYVDTREAAENYLVAIIVRELEPKLGKKGKIIKKMFDVYSYDVALGYTD